jgi:aryl-alcohol dehydrogenase-like predicted oxidoreductase
VRLAKAIQLIKPGRPLAHPVSEVLEEELEPTRGVQLDEACGAIAELVEAGQVRHVGLSEVGAETIRRAQRVHPIADLQIEYSLVSRGIEEDILPTCREFGVGVTAYGVLSRGLISGHWLRGRALAPGDLRRHAPRFSEANLDRNLLLVERLRGVADARDATLAQLAIAWVLARGDDIVPLVGARTRERLEEALGALDLELGPQAVAELEKVVPAEAVAGERYNPQQMALLDSERRSSRV